MRLFKNYSKEIIVIAIAYIAIMIMGLFGILRLYFPFVPFIFSISDMLWVYAGCLLLELVPVNGKKKILIVAIPYIGVVIDELMQGFFPYYPHPHTELASLFWSGTFDPIDLIAYTLGFILALLTWQLIKRT